MFSSCAGVKTKCFPHSQRQKLFAVVVDLGFHRELLEHGLRKLCEIVTLPDGTAILEELGLLFVRHAFEFRSRPSTKDVVQLGDSAAADGAPKGCLCLIDKPTLEIQEWPSAKATTELRFGKSRRTDPDGVPRQLRRHMGTRDRSSCGCDAPDALW